ncbi:adenylate kinase [Thalictrum thalictroides]|uniref:adenylate kinase n=1 Tax=Thalictrum thalictroides TaxID=46969 RepID=A0A7J6WUH4_THATH|nr:adenylate kinase [Thalictrum thalictroides]
MTSSTSSSVDLENVESVDLMTKLLRRMKCSTKPDKRLILIGPPGSGKGTQSSMIKDEYCLCHLATGDMLRAAKATLGIKEREAMDKGGGRIYHTKSTPPKVYGVDDITREPLIQRDDDTATVLKSRLEAFHRQTESVIDYYAKKGVVANIHADKLPKDVSAEVKKVLSS